MQPNPSTQAAQLCMQLGKQVREGAAPVNLPPIQVSHYPIYDTGLAACLGTLGIQFRDPVPFTDDVDESSGFRRSCFWLCDAAPAAELENQHKTEEMCAAWEHRARFESEHPLHPLVAMRDMLDARTWWVNVIKGRIGIASETREKDPFLTNSLRDASLLKAVGFRVLAFTGRAFVLAGTHNGTPAKAVLEMAAKPEGASPAQWMHCVARNFERLLAIAKEHVPVIRLRDGDQTLILRADATPKTRDKFHDLFQ